MSNIPTETIASRMYACHARDGWQAAGALLFEGAQEIERLMRERDEFKRMIGPAEDIERENERLRAALQGIATNKLSSTTSGDPSYVAGVKVGLSMVADMAKRALGVSS